MINIISTFYISKTDNILDTYRNEELLTSLKKNIQNKMIKKIHLFLDDTDSEDKIKTLIDDFFYEKIHIIEIGKKVKHKDYFDYAKTNLQNEICMISNTDIFLFEACENIINSIKYNQIAFALSRYEYDMSCPQVTNYLGSHDAYIFNPSFFITSFDSINYYPNIPGIETNIIKLFLDNNYKVYNPCYEIKIVHLHKSQLRNYSGSWIGLHENGNIKQFIKSEWCIPPCTSDKIFITHKRNYDIKSITSSLIPAHEDAVKIEKIKKVISFSLWGENPTYNIGAIKNAKNALSIYPDFECWFYIHKDTVPSSTIVELNKLPNVKIILKYGDLLTNKPMMWRFETIDEPDVELMLVRDTDTRFLLREKMAVNEWLESNTVFHIMRDHPHHTFCILGGMFGSRKIPEIPSWKDVMNNYLQDGVRDYDQSFLKDYIYPHINNNCMIHASFNAVETNCKPFPIIHDTDLRFVGEYVYFDESRSQEHIDILSLYLKNKIHI